MTDDPSAPPSPPPPPVPGLEEARRLVEEERTRRAQACLEALGKVLREHRCSLTARIDRHSDASGEHLHLRAVPLVIPEP